MRTFPLLVLGVAGLGALTGAAVTKRSATAAPPLPQLPTLACTDADGDGYGVGCAKGPDCNDHDPGVHPGAVEACNGKDDDCNALADDAPSCAVPKRLSSRVLVPAGSFAMGSTSGAKDEQPVHPVTGAAFELDRYEVTNARYAACVKSGKCTPPSISGSKTRAHYFDDAKFADYPVIFVSWQQADAFCKADSGRLPTEAEWERAAKGTDGPRTYPWGESAPDCTKANFAGCVGDTDLTGRREAGTSPYGAYDMAGNVWEWTADWYDAGYYGSSPAIDPKGPSAGKLRVMRGGCWVSGKDSLRTTCRKAELPQSWAPNVGFRCAYPVSSTKGGA